MIEIQKIDPRSKADVKRYIDLPYPLYRDNPNWVPFLRMDMANMLNAEKHPFYEHSEAEFFIARRDGEDVARLAMLENKPYNKYHSKKQAQFYHFECIEDFEVAEALFARGFEWARSRGLNQVVGPKGFGPFDGYGILVEGFEHRQMMIMMNYNPPYFPGFMEKLGFRKEVDFVSCSLPPDKFQLPERVHRIAERAAQRSGLRVLRFKNKRELKQIGMRVGKVYNDIFINNWEYYPLTEKELDFHINGILTVAVPNLIKVIVHDEDIVGFLFGFPDVSAAIQRSRGQLFPFGFADLMLELKRANTVSLNGAGMLPAYQGRGGNALLYSEMQKTIQDSGFQHAELTQVAESAVQMRRDLENVGGIAYKNHRVFIRDI
ncbi:MAG: hypothetical protein JXA97_03015 [Anaerolineales bacterium]|nr:hypothetical protein [Anaerolineales bacterium]